MVWPRHERGRLAGRDPALELRNERQARAGRRVAMPAHDRSVARDDRPERVHDREHRHPGAVHGARRRSLPGRLALLVGERLPDRGGAAGAAPSQREPARRALRIAARPSSRSG
jgi:hypothetical protein